MSLNERKYLTPKEIDLLLTAARRYGREPDRNYCMILMGYRHGLRVSELVSLRWSQIDWRDERIFVPRLKSGKDTTHPLGSLEIKALRKLKYDHSGRYIFVSQRGGHVSDRQFRALLSEIGELAGLGHCHPHQLRHACGYALANKGTDTRLIQDYLGHRSIASTAIYTELNAVRFEGLWD